MDYLISFVATLDPNCRSSSSKTIPATRWPRYDTTARQMLLVQDSDGEEPLAIGRDDARAEAMEVVVRLSLKYPL